MSAPITFLFGAAAGAAVMYYLGSGSGAVAGAGPTKTKTNKFKRVDVFPEATSYKASLRATYTALAQVFGRPKQYPEGSDTYNEWVFRGTDGKLFTIYDNADVGSAASTPNTLYTWHVGASGGAAEFKKWVTSKLRSPR